MVSDTVSLSSSKHGDDEGVLNESNCLSSGSRRIIQGPAEKPDDF
jgi:hypothetical protein